MAKTAWLVLLFFGAAAPTAATVIYNESTFPNFSSSGGSPTMLPLSPGFNEIIGSNGSQDTSVRDYVTITLPTGFLLSSLTLINTGALGAEGFIGIEAGDQVTLPPNTTTAAGLLGWWHYTPSDANTNLLPEMGVSAMGSSGFTSPLGAGDYSLWIQDTSTGLFEYQFNLQVTPAPEPATWHMSFFAAPFLLDFARRKTRRG